MGQAGAPGAQTLTLLAAPVTGLIVDALAQGALGQSAVRRAVGSPAQTTLRVHLGRLERFGVIVRERGDCFPHAIDVELTPAGVELLVVRAALRHWLERAPDGPLTPGSPATKAAIDAFADSWSTGILRALAVKPSTLTELDRSIDSLNYPSLERRLAGLKLADQVVTSNGHGTGRHYAVTQWTREAVEPLIAAGHWEGHHLTQVTAPMSRLDAETILRLAIPLLRPSGDVSGSIRMTAEVAGTYRHSSAGVNVEAHEGKVASCATRLEDTPDAWSNGSPTAWLAAIADADTTGLELGGDRDLILAILGELHRVLSGTTADRLDQ